jgi:hypothetical protein
VCEKRIVDHGGFIAITPDGMTRPCGRIGYDRHFEALLEQVPQMSLHAHVGEHAAEHHFAHVTFA